MSAKFICSIILSATFMTSCAPVEYAIYNGREALKEKTPYQKEKENIYGNMKRYGINRDNVQAMRRLRETTSPYSDPHTMIGVDDLYNPGEHYRVEMDEFILTVKVPDAKKIPGQWIWPYTNTRTPEPKMAKLLQNNKGYVDVVKLGWITSKSILPACLVGRCDMMSFSVAYRIVGHQERDRFSTPERFKETASISQRSFIPTQAEIERALRERLIDSRIGNRIVLSPRPVVINGRVWIYQVSGAPDSQDYYYKTFLSPDRIVGINFALPTYDYNANPDPSTYPAAIKRAIAIMEEMVASLRVVNTKDDGSPDPFVIERVEPAPLPVREKPPVAE